MPVLFIMHRAFCLECRLLRRVAMRSAYSLDSIFNAVHDCYSTPERMKTERWRIGTMLLLAVSNLWVWAMDTKHELLQEIFSTALIPLLEISSSNVSRTLQRAGVKVVIVFCRTPEYRELIAQGQIPSLISSFEGDSTFVSELDEFKAIFK